MKDKIFMFKCKDHDHRGSLRFQYRQYFGSKKHFSILLWYSEHTYTHLKQVSEVEMISREKEKEKRRYLNGRPFIMAVKQSQRVLVKKKETLSFKSERNYGHKRILKERRTDYTLNIRESNRRKIRK